MAEKKPPTQKQLQFRQVADVLSKGIDRNLTSSEWGQFGRMINNFGFPIVLDCAEKFVKANMDIEEKKKCMIPYMWGILKRSKVPVERSEAPDIEDILGKDRRI
jgi:hypothetical protein